MGAAGTGVRAGEGAAVRAPPRLWWPGWIGAALVLTGAGAAVWSLTLPLEPNRDGVPDDVRVGLMWSAVAVGALAFTFVVGRKDSASDGDERRNRVACRLAAAAAGLVVAISGLPPTVAELRRQVDGGVPRMAIALLVAAQAIVIVGTVVMASAPPARVPGRRRPAVAAGGVLAAVVALAGSLLVARALERSAVETATAASPAAEPRGVAELPGEVAWTHDVPPDEQAEHVSRRVVPAGTGVALAVSDGIRGLDTRTGRERWRYRRPGAELVDLRASPGGRWVRAAFDPSGPSWSQLVVVVDGRTGEVAMEIHDPDRAVYEAEDVTDHALVSWRLDGWVQAFDPAGGDRLWTWRAPDGCGLEAPDRRFELTAGAGVVFVSMACPAAGELAGSGPYDGRLRLLALDDRTGAELWSHDERFRDVDDIPLPRVETSPAGRTVDLVWNLDRDGESRYRARFLDAARGEVIAARDDAEPRRWPSDGGWVAEATAPGGSDQSDEELVIYGAGPDSTGSTDSTGGTTITTGCAYLDEVELIAAGDALLQLCDDREPEALVVVPRDDPDDRRSIRFALPEIADEQDARPIVTPSGVVVDGGLGRVIGLG